MGVRFLRGGDGGFRARACMQVGSPLLGACSRVNSSAWAHEVGRTCARACGCGRAGLTNWLK